MLVSLVALGHSEVLSTREALRAQAEARLLVDDLTRLLAVLPELKTLPKARLPSLPLRHHGQIETVREDDLVLGWAVLFNGEAALLAAKFPTPVEGEHLVVPHGEGRLGAGVDAWRVSQNKGKGVKELK